MRRIFWFSGVVLMLIAALSGCGMKSQEQAAATSNDSLLASNPVEQPQGNLAPQAEYQPQEQPKKEEPPATSSKPAAHPTAKRSSAPAEKSADRGVTLESGAPINIAVSAQITSENANVGDPWTGEVKENVIVGNTVVIPAGSRVEGVVNGVKPAEKGSRAFLVLGVRSIDVNGKSYDVNASADSIIAGSTRARNVGAVAGGAAAGALIGRAIGGGGKGALIGGLLGGATAGGAVAASKGYQAMIKEGTILTFSVIHKVFMRS